jgi:micrococcal nuclease
MTARRSALGLAAVALAVTACLAPAPATAPSPGTTPFPISNPASPGDPSAFAPEGLTETAQVVRVVDGDTLVIDRGNGEERLRYIGIDAPESVKPESPVEFMGHEAAEANAALVEGRELVLERDVSDTDRFGRLLRYAWYREGDEWRLVNLELVGEGYAQAVSFPPDVRRQDELRNAERGARERGIGLWGPATPLP